MKHIVFVLMLLFSQISSVMAASEDGNYIFSIGHKGVQGKDQILFNSFADESVVSGQKATVSWTLNKSIGSFSIVIDGKAVSSAESGEFAIYPQQSSEVKISLFDNVTNKVIEEHVHKIDVFGAPVIHTLDADTQIARSGSNIVLRWTGENLGTITFNPAALAINTDSAIVKLNGDTTYEMTATSKSGLFATKSVSIKASDYIPTITSFSIDKTEVYRGNAVGLTWTSIDSESVDLFVDGVLKVSGLAKDGYYDYIVEKTGRQYLQLRAKDKIFGLYGLVEKKEIYAKESDSWDFLPRLKRTGSISLGQSADFEWAANETATSLSVSYKTDNASVWTNLPISSLSGSYSLPMNDSQAKKAQIKFDLIKSSGAIASSTITVSIIKASIKNEVVKDGDSAVLVVEQGVDGPVSVYVNGLKSKVAYNGDNEILVKSSGHHAIVLKTGDNDENTVLSLEMTSLPGWFRAPDLSKAVAFEGESIVLSWLIESPFQSVSIKRVNNLGAETVIDGNPISGTFVDKLSSEELKVTYTVTATSSTGEQITEVLNAFLAKPALSASEINFGKSITATYLPTTPNKQLYIDGKVTSSLIGSSDNISGLSVGNHLIEIRSSYGKYPDRNSVLSQNINVLPSNSVELQSNYGIVEVGKEFIWSWSIPSEYKSVEIYEKKGTSEKVLISTEIQGAYTSLLETYADSVLSVKAISGSGTVFEKSITVYGIEVSAINEEYSSTETVPIPFKSTSGIDVYINDEYYGYSTSSATTMPIPATKFVTGTNTIRITSRRSVTGQKMDAVRTFVKLGEIIATNDVDIALYGKYTGMKWNVSSDYDSVSVNRLENGITETVSSSLSGYHGKEMQRSAVKYTVIAKTKKGKVTSVELPQINYYEVILPASLDGNNDAILKMQSSAAKYMKVELNGVLYQGRYFSSNGSIITIGSNYFNEGENTVAITPNDGGHKYSAIVTKMDSAKIYPNTDYDYAVIGKEVVYEWDVSTNYSIAKLTVTSNGVTKEVSSGNAGEYKHIKSAYNETFTLNLETPDGYKTSFSKIVYPITASVPLGAVDYTNPSVTYSTSGKYHTYNVYVNNQLAVSKTTTAASVEVPSSAFSDGDNVLKVVPYDARTMGWETHLHKMEPISASSNYSVALVSTDIIFEWDVPEEYVSTTVYIGTTKISTEKKGTYKTKRSSWSQAMVLSVTGTNSSGAKYVKNVDVKSLQVTPSTPRVVSGKYFLADIYGTAQKYDLYINDVYSSSYTMDIDGDYFSHSLFEDGMNKIEFRPIGTTDKVDSWFGQVFAYKDASLSFTSEYSGFAPGQSVPFEWEIDSTLYKNISINHYNGETKVTKVVSTDASGSAEVIKSYGDNVTIKATTMAGDAYSKTISTSTFWIYSYNNIVSQGNSVAVKFQGTYSLGDYAYVYINGEYINRIYGWHQYPGTTYFNESYFNVGDNELRIKHLDVGTNKIQDFVVNVERLPNMEIETDYDVITTYDKAVFTWLIPDIYSNVKVVSSVDGEISQSMSGEYVYTPKTMPSLGKVTLTVTATTPEGVTATVSKTVKVSYIRAVVGTETDLSVTSKDIEIIPGYGPKVSFSAPHTANNSAGYIYVNGVNKYSIYSTLNDLILDTSYFNYGENNLEIFAKTELVGNKPSDRSLTYVGKVTMLEGPVITAPKAAIVGEKVTFSWTTPSQYASVSVTAKINGVETIISTEKNGSYEYVKTKSSDVITLNAIKNDINITQTATINYAEFDVASTTISSTQGIAMDYDMGSALSGNYFTLFVNGVSQGNTLSTTTVSGVKAIISTNAALRQGLNTIEVKYYYANALISTWTKEVTMTPSPEFAAEHSMMHIGDIAGVQWSADAPYTNVKVVLYENGSTEGNIVSDGKMTGSYSYLKSSGGDILKMEATGPNGLIYSKTIPIYYYSVLFPALVASGQDVTYTIASSYGSFKVYVNGTQRRITTKDGTYTDLSAFFTVGDNAIKVVPYGTESSTATEWTGRVIVAAAPELTTNYSLVNEGDIVQVSWDAPSVYNNVKISSSGVSGEKVLSASGSKGVASFIKEKGLDKIKIEASNDSGAIYGKTIDVNSLSFTLPTTATKGLSVPYSFQSGIGTAKVYVNGLLIKSISTSANTLVSYSIASTSLNVGNNIVEVIISGTSASTAQNWSGNITVTE